jgi:hypothetical protein
MKLTLESSLLPMVQSALLIGAPLSFGVYGCVWLQRNRLPLAMRRAYPDCFPWKLDRMSRAASGRLR